MLYHVQQPAHDARKALFSSRTDIAAESLRSLLLAAIYIDRFPASAKLNALAGERLVWDNTGRL